MLAICFYFVFSILVLVTVSLVQTQVEIFKRYPGNIYSDFITGYSVRSKVKCCSECSITEGCLVVSYHKGNRTCRLSSKSIGDGTYLITNAEWDVFFVAGYDECSSNPCQNGGTCTDGIHQYSCICAGGYQGDNCETDSDECGSNPCQNGGICTDGINQYSCTCVSGYEGNNCETDTDECSSSPCQNGGTCTDDVNQYLCLCVDGYEGNNCETDSDECSSNPCQNGGTCVDQVNQYSCTCASGYEGDNCETESDECSSNPCQNGGTCTDEVNQYSCTCVEGYDGDNCETYLCPLNWKFFEDNCYLFAQTQEEWYEAADVCSVYSSRLVDILSDAEWTFIKEKLDEVADGDYWTGGNHIEVEDQLVWGYPSHGLMTFENFGNGEPSGHCDKCVVIDSRPFYTWSDLPCSVAARYICKK